MYTVFVDGNILYSPILSNEGYPILNAKVVKELNKAGSFEFTLPPNNVMYDITQKLKSIVTVTRNDKEFFRGRVLHDEKDFYKRKAVYCEGELAFLLDSIQRPYSFQGNIPFLFEHLLNNHNSQVDPWKQFQLGNVTVTDSNDYINRESTVYPNTFDEMNEKLVNTHGGYLKTRLYNGVRFLDYVQESGKNNSQVIKFGENLLDITEYITAENVFTVLIPLGAKGTDEEGKGTPRLTIESVNGGKDYIENELGISLFGRIVKVQEWDDVTVADNLLKKGIAFLESGIEMSVSLTMKAIDLHLIDVNTESIEVGDKVRVLSEPHNIDTFFQCSKIELDLLEPDKSVYTFGTTFTSLTEKRINESKQIDKISSNSKQYVSDLKGIATKMTSKGIFNILTNNGQIQGIIHDGDNIFVRDNNIKINAQTLDIQSVKNGVIENHTVVYDFIKMCFFKIKFTFDENIDASLADVVIAKINTIYAPKGISTSLNIGENVDSVSAIITTTGDINIRGGEIASGTYIYLEGCWNY